MSNKENKPKLSSKNLILHLKNDKGIKFKIVKEAEAEKYLEQENNYMRTASYRKNFNKYEKGKNKGKYVNLEFAYLQELSRIDYRLRLIIHQMCSDIEHFMKVKLVDDITNNKKEDGYSIVSDYLSTNNKSVGMIEKASKSSYTCDLCAKYFTIEKDENGNNRITKYDDCPVWVLVELLTFGGFINFYIFYKEKYGEKHYSRSILNTVRMIRNGVDHNNCMLTNLSRTNDGISSEISKYVATIPEISKQTRKKQLRYRTTAEFVTLLYMYKDVVPNSEKSKCIEALKELFNKSMLKNKEYFEECELVKACYDFTKKVLLSIFK